MSSFTMKGWLLDECQQRGLWHDEAEAVVNAVRESLEAQRVQWSSPMEGYPPEMRAVLLMSLKREGLKYIDENKPRHFARPSFE